MLSSALTKSTSNGKRVSAHHEDVKHIEKEEVISVVSSSQPAWGTSFIIDVRENNVLVLENTLAFTLSTLTCVGQANAAYIPIQFHVDHIDVISNGSILSTIYPETQFLQQNLYFRDEDRLLSNLGSGIYSNPTALATLADNQNTYYFNLFDYMKSADGYPLLSASHAHQLRVFMKPMSECVFNTTGAYSGNIVSCNLLQRVVRLREAEADHLRREMVMHKLTHKHCDVKRQIYSVPAGQLSVTIPLQSFVDNVSVLQFMVRNAAPTGTNCYTFLPIKDFEIRNSAGSNVVGGVVIPQRQNLYVMGNKYFRSSYLAETEFGSTNNNAYVYTYSWAHSPEHAVLWGQFDGHYRFTGSETLVINFNAATVASQVDIHAYCQAGTVQSSSGITKIAL